MFKLLRFVITNVELPCATTIFHFVFRFILKMYDSSFHGKPVPRISYVNPFLIRFSADARFFRKKKRKYVYYLRYLYCICIFLQPVTTLYIRDAKLSWFEIQLEKGIFKKREKRIIGSKRKELRSFTADAPAVESLSTAAANTCWKKNRMNNKESKRQSQQKSWESIRMYSNGLI